jgi:hypothetical protein
MAARPFGDLLQDRHHCGIDALCGRGPLVSAMVAPPALYSAVMMGANTVCSESVVGGAFFRSQQHDVPKNATVMPGLRDYSFRLGNAKVEVPDAYRGRLTNHGGDAMESIEYGGLMQANAVRVFSERNPARRLNALREL